MKPHPNQGKQIKSLYDLYKAAAKRQAVCTPRSYPTPTYIPAAFVLNYQGRVLFGMIHNGMYIYKPNTK